MRFSVIVPNRDGRQTLGEALSALLAARPPPGEIIVVDDASRDDSADVAAKFPVRLIRHETSRGAAAARNSGARAAGGEVLVFIDNDVVVGPSAFSLLDENFRRPEVSGVIGLLQPVTRFANLCSQYKNFYMHYTYMKLPEPVTVFYTSIAAIRKEVFRDCGGFDESYRSATIEDMEFGIRVTGRGRKLIIDRGLQVEHLRRYSFGDLMKTAFRRAAGLAKIALRDRLSRQRKRSYITTSPSFLLGIVLSFLVLLFLFLAAALGSRLCLGLGLGGYLALLAANLGFLVGLSRRTRPSFFVLGGGMIYIDLLAHGFGAVWGALTFLGGKKY